MRTRSLSDASESLRKATLRRELVDLRADQDAVVLTMAKVSVGSVMQSGEQLITLPPLLTAKTALWSAMVEAGIGKSELARRLGCDEKAVRRLLSFRHRSQIDRIAAALACLGKRLVVDLADAA